MDSNSALMSVLSNLHEKYKLLSRIFEATKGLECISLDDELTIASFLNTRQTAMNSIDGLDKKNRELLNRLPAALKAKINSLIFPRGEPVTLDNKLQTDIFDTNKHCMLLLKRIVEADERFNKKVKGKIKIV